MDTVVRVAVADLVVRVVVVVVVTVVVVVVAAVGARYVVVGAE
ncbi:hypothetical protein [Actinokineospora inagensis]|nr:hypothetical protein [Actinokineospora inagensis]